MRAYKYKSKINKLSENMADFFLIIGIVLSSMTGLRIMKVGPSEIILLFWSIYIYIKYYTELKNNHYTELKNNYLMRFWIIWIALLMCGTTFCLFLIPEQSKPTEIFTYVYLFIVSLALYIGLMQKKQIEVEKILKKIFFVGGIIFGFLYFYAQNVSASFFGMSLFFGGVRFTGGAINPHQLALFTGAMFFVGIYYIFSRKVRFFNKVIYGLTAYVYWIVSLSTKSSTLIVATVLALIFGLLNGIEKIDNRKMGFFLFFSITFSLMIIFIVNWQGLLNFFLEWVNEDPNGMNRFEIWSSFDEVVQKSIIFGLGPGPHALNGYVEFHNTYLEIFAISGMLGFINFIAFLLRLFKKFYLNIHIFTIFIFLLGYGISGYVMRRLAFWVILIICIAIEEKRSKEKPALKV